jgi:phage terminase large subunit
MSKARMKLVIDKQPEGTRSPNLADAVVMAYWPVDSFAYDSSFDWL